MTPEHRYFKAFQNITCSASASIHYNTLKVHVCKIYSYSDCWKIEKTAIVHHLLFFSSMAYRETGVSNSFTKINYAGAYMILSAQIFVGSTKKIYVIGQNMGVKGEVE